jgi:glycolate oxidase FAD binding subunit
MRDILIDYQAQLGDLVSPDETLRIQGGGTKDFLGGHLTGIPFSTDGYEGIVCYEPEELFVTVRSGTKILDLQSELATRGQCLAFDPLLLGESCTVGGMVASGLQGPDRISMGPLRDYLLGVTMADGRGQLLRFGGTVIKNVSGFDVSRLMGGSWGTLGLLLDVTFKTLPSPARSETHVLDMSQKMAIETTHRLVGEGFPIRASTFLGNEEGQLYLALAGDAASLELGITSLQGRWGGTRMEHPEGHAFWQSLRTLEHHFLKGDGLEGKTLWMITCPPLREPLPLPGDTLIEWHGGRRWWWGDGVPDELINQLQKQGGQVRAVRFPWGTTHFGEGLHRPYPIGNLDARIRGVFDPDHRLNQRWVSHAR